jgi:hypothetical protein
MNCAAAIRRFDRHDGLVIDEVAHGELADVGLTADDRGTYRSDHTGGLELEVKHASRSIRETDVCTSIFRLR